LGVSSNSFFKEYIEDGQSPENAEIDLKKLEEKYSKNKPTFSPLELVICIALVMIGCVLFCAMPDEMGIWGWITVSI
jgi:hypothetical protein